jgi:hypothetical protein
MKRVDIIRKELDKFPDIKIRTLANKLYKQSPELWMSVESCRAQIRKVTGSCGDRARQEIKDPEKRKYFRNKTAENESFNKLPKPQTSLKKWSIFQLRGNHKAFIIGDIHIPFYNRECLEIAVNDSIKFGTDLIILNGDIFDFYKISRWQTDPRERKFSQELEACKQFLMWLREKFPKARIIFKHGNHEERYENYLILKAPELLDIAKFDMSSILEFNDLGIEEIRDMRPIKLNELAIIHGHEYKFSISNPVNPARGLFLRAKINALTNHFHQSSSHSETNMEGKVTSCYSLGCMSELRPKYMPLNKWNHGFANVETSGQKEFNVLNKKIIDGKIYPA